MEVLSTSKEKIFSLKTRFINASLKIKVIVVAVILLVVWFGYSRITAAQNQQPSYQTAQVQRGTIISTISESGNVSSANQVNVNSPTDGVITDIYVKNGDQLNTGDKLFTVKSTATPQEKESAYASYLSAQNSLKSAQAKMNSLQSALFKANQSFITDKGIANPSDQDKVDPKYIEENADWLQAEADYKNQQGVIAQTQAALNSAALSYQATQDSVVTAPVAGTVANLAAITGSTVTASSSNNNNSSSSNSSGSSGSSGSTVLILGDFSNLLIDAQVNEVDIPNIHAGQKATITIDAFPGKTFVGKVANVDTVGTTSSGVVTYSVYITLIAPPSDIQPGMSASVTIETNRKDDALEVPATAVQTTNGTATVRVLKNGQINQVQVETGISSDTDTEIVSGLSEGDTVVTSVATTTQTGGQSSTSSPFSGLGGNRGFGGGGRSGGGGGIRIRTGGGG